jgi:hypothetical protein
VFSAGVPTIIGYGLALLLYTDDGPEGYNKTALIFLIFFTSFANSLYAVSFFVAALSGVFYFKRL